MKRWKVEDRQLIVPAIDFIRYVPPAKQSEIYGARVSGLFLQTSLPAVHWPELPDPVFPDNDQHWRAFPGWPITSVQRWKMFPNQRRIFVLIPKADSGPGYRIWNCFTAMVPEATFTALPGMHVWFCRDCRRGYGDRDLAAAHMILDH